MKAWFALFALTIGVVTLPAQLPTVTIPKDTATLEGNSDCTMPFSHPRSRFQWLVNGGQVCVSSGLVQSIQFRLDGGNTGGQALTLSPTLTAYSVPVTPSAMGTNWAKNIAGATGKVVFKGTLNVPAVKRTYPLPNPFTVTIPFSVPYVFLRLRGNLLLDWVCSNGSGGTWVADGVFISNQTGGGRSTDIWADQACLSPSGDRVTTQVAQQAGAIGQPLSVTMKVIPGQGQLDTLVHWVGFSHRAISGIPLPLDLAGMGLSGCRLATDIQAMVIGKAPANSWPVPLDSGLIGQAVFFQGAAIDSRSTNLVVSSNACQVHLGPATPPTEGPVQMVSCTSYTGQADGTITTNGYSAPVILLNGNFY